MSAQAREAAADRAVEREALLPERVFSHQMIEVMSPAMHFW